MDSYERIGYACLAVVGIAYVAAMVLGLISAFPFGILVLVGLLGVGVLLVKVIRERLASAEDDYYSDNVEK
jgi:hypothetical protein